jgi:hypothetical protein
VLLVRHFTSPQEKDNTPAAVEPPKPTPVQPQPRPEPQPEPEPPPKQVPQPEPEPGPKIDAAPKKTLNLSAPVSAAFAGGSGRYIIFQLADGKLVIYDAVAGKITGNVIGGDAGTLVAASREKLYLGRPKDSRIVRFDLKTGRQEAVASQAIEPESLLHLAVGSCSDGPLLIVTRKSPTEHRVRLLDPDTFTDLQFRVNDRTQEISALPCILPRAPTRAAISADGRSITLDNIGLIRRPYDWSRLSEDTTDFVPGPVGTSFVGPAIRSDSWRITSNPPPAGLLRHYFPTSSAFLVFAEYTRGAAPTVKLYLQAIGLGENKPLGELPGGEAVTAMAKLDPKWITQLRQRMFFVPDPGLLVLVPPGSSTVHLYPVDLPAMLEKANKWMIFTSVAPAEVRPGQPYTYQVNVVAREGPVKYTVRTVTSDAMTLTPDGLFRWDNPPASAVTREITFITFDAKGRQVWQIISLPLPPRTVDLPPKKDPAAGDAPKKDPG